MKISLRLIIPLFIFTSFASADHHGDKLKLAREVIELMDADAMIDGMTEQMKSMMQNMAAQQGNSSEQRNALQDRIVEISMEAAREMIKEFDKLYADVYTMEELAGMKEFFGSSVGRSMLQKQPELMGRIMPMVQQMQQGMAPKIQAAIAEIKQAATAPGTEENE